MGCSDCRELLSADLDGEADLAAVAAARAHLAGCADCARWYAAAVGVNRLARTELAEPAPALSGSRLAAVLDELPAPASARRRLLHLSARWALAAVGVAQIALALLAFLVPEEHHHTGAPSMLGADMAHLANESSAWNLALGVGFVAGAAWIRHLAGLLPALGCFVALLALVSALDLAAGNVHTGRVTAHLLVLAGLGLVALIVRTRAPDDRSHPIPVAVTPDEWSPSPATPADDRRPLLGKPRTDPAAHRRVA